ncbi:hypothetical protein HMPREF1147_0008 [Selenomonas sp. FOBRC9]|nr:hypothetical protein HMPREF1147_0008 [Selenomonas sp. FOBRC9]
MFKEINFTEFSAQVRKIPLDESRRYTAMTFGPRFLYGERES